MWSVISSHLLSFNPSGAWSFEDLQECPGSHERRKMGKFYILQGSIVTDSTAVTTTSFFEDHAPFVVCLLRPHKWEGNDNSKQVRSTRQWRYRQTWFLWSLCVCKKKKRRLVFPQPHSILKVPLIIFILICGVLLEFLLLEENIICWPL